MIVPSILCEIQESDKGHWHIPVSEEGLLEKDRTWLCVTRQNSVTVTNEAGVVQNFVTSLQSQTLTFFFLNTQVSISSALFISLRNFLYYKYSL